MFSIVAIAVVNNRTTNSRCVPAFGQVDSMSTPDYLSRRDECAASQFSIVLPTPEPKPASSTVFPSHGDKAPQSSRRTRVCAMSPQT